MLEVYLSRHRCIPLTLFMSFHTGYVQGMSDLLSPLLFVTQNEVESFWCLTGFMKLVVSRNIPHCPDQPTAAFENVSFVCPFYPSSEAVPYSCGTLIKNKVSSEVATLKFKVSC